MCDKEMVKVATKEQLDDLVNLAYLLWQTDRKELITEINSLLNNKDAVFFIKYFEGEAIGFAQCQLRRDYVEGTESSPVGYLEGIYISPNFRNLGFARQLVEVCEKWAREKGCQEFASDCELDNEQSIKFHNAVGFKEANRIVCFTKKI